MLVGVAFSSIEPKACLYPTLFTSGGFFSLLLLRGVAQAGGTSFPYVQLTVLETQLGTWSGRDAQSDGRMHSILRTSFILLLPTSAFSTFHVGLALSRRLKLILTCSVLNSHPATTTPRALAATSRAHPTRGYMSPSRARAAIALDTGRLVLGVARVRLRVGA